MKSKKSQHGYGLDEESMMRVRSIALPLFFYIIFLAMLPACEREEKGIHSEEEIIKGSIVKYNAALIGMYRKLKISELNNVASKLEISKNNAILLSFLTDKIYMESDLIYIDFEKVEINPEDRAEVGSREKWRWRHLELNTGKEVKPWRVDEQRLIYHLIKDVKKGWIVDKVEIVQESESTPNKGDSAAKKD